MAAGALFLLLTACASKPPSTTAGCTQANCATMLQGCGVDLTDDPDYAWCISNTPSPPDGGTFPPDPDSCVQVCQKSGEGILVQCLADQTTACGGELPGASPLEVESCQAKQLAGAGKVFSARCDNDCQVLRASCQDACPLTGFDACYQCSLQCALQAITCREKCPSETARCLDGKQDGNETGVDCGGDCGPCPEGDDCTSNADCVSGQCTGGTVCAAVAACARVGDCPGDDCLNGTCR
jgi:hypothetical protein